MTGKQRFVTALKGGIPDRLPLFDFLDSNLFIQRVIGRKPEAYLARDVMEATLTYGLDGAFIGYGGFGGYDSTAELALGENHYRDEWGTVWEKTTYSWPSDAPVDHPLKEWSDLKKYRLPEWTLSACPKTWVSSRDRSSRSTTSAGSCFPFSLTSFPRRPATPTSTSTLTIWVRLVSTGCTRFKEPPTCPCAR